MFIFSLNVVRLVCYYGYELKCHNDSSFFFDLRSLLLINIGIKVQISCPSERAPKLINMFCNNIIINFYVFTLDFSAFNFTYFKDVFKPHLDINFSVHCNRIAA